METYEKKYNEALKWIESIYTELNHERQMEAEAFFPELKKSEDDESKKWILEYLHDGLRKSDEQFKAYFKTAIAWLEKQGEKKIEENTDFTIYYPLKKGKGKYESIPYSFYGTLTSFSENIDLINFLRNCFYSEEECEEWIKKQGEQKQVSVTDEWIENYWQHEKVNNLYSYDKGDEIQFDHQGFVRFCKKYCKIEPKFKVGDWVVYEEKCYKVNYNGCGYELIDQNGLKESLVYGVVDNNAHLWTINDAKDGNVLITENIIIIYKEKDNGWLNSYVTIYHDKSFSIDDERIVINRLVKDIHPATKEQRNLLFQKMKKAGYEWDAEKKELKIIDWSKHVECNPNPPSIYEESALSKKNETSEIEGLYYAKTILEKTLGKVEGYQTDDGILEHKFAIVTVKKLCEQKEHKIKQEKI